MPIYNKLVRDRILEIIKANGQKATHRILSADEYAVELTKKLFEEVEEYSIGYGLPSNLSDYERFEKKLSNILEDVYFFDYSKIKVQKILDKIKIQKDGLENFLIGEW